MKVDLDKIKANKSKFEKKWLQILMIFVKQTNNDLYQVKRQGNFIIVSTRKENPILLRIPVTLQA